MSTSLVLREMQFKTMRYCVTAIQLAECKKSKNTPCWRTHGQEDLCFSSYGCEISSATFGKQFCAVL